MSDKEAARATIRHRTGKQGAASRAPKAKAPPAASPTPRERAVPAAAAPEKRAARHPDVAGAMARLAAAHRVAGKRSAKISARVDPGVLGAAAERLGLDRQDVSEVVNASLALAAAPDRFNEWLRNTKDTLPDDFEPAI
jgi:hypothetical protein